MMRIIVITDTSFAASEAESIRILLSEGVDRVHLRKPQSAEADMRRLIEALPPELYPRLTLQDHLHLAGEYGIGGVHLNARNPEIPAGFGGLISRSCHSFGEIASHPTEDYLFLSPIFDSISKTGYRAGYAPDELRKAFAQGIINPRVAALGGIRPEHLPALQEYGFGGAAFLGYIRQGADYIGLGPFRFTQTKRNLSPVLGLEGYRTIMECCRNAGIALPVVAIGGITAADVENILATGVTGIALSGALLQAENTLEETQRIINIINRTKQ